MKVSWLAVMLAVPMLAGCVDFLDDNEVDRVVYPADVGHDPQEITVTGVQIHELTIDSGDVQLDTIVYEPLTTDSPGDGEKATWPVVIMLHPYGFPKETYTNAPVSGDGPVSTPSTDLMQEFAEGGLLTVAYDSRGWFQSTGTTTLGGLAEMNDLLTVINYTHTNFDTNGLVGVTGASLGGGQALRAWEKFDDITTVVAHQGWVDLYEGLAPGSVLKLEWTAALGAVTVPGTQGARLSPMVQEWITTLATRTDAAAVDAVEAQLDSRSLLDGSKNVDKPIFMCQGMQESLFPQSHQVWEHAAGFARAHYYEGGHNTFDGECWSKTKAWFQFFLGGYDTAVDAWPAVTSVDHNGDGSMASYGASRIKEIDNRVGYLHSEQIVDYAAPNRTFTIEQRGISNPVGEPQAVWETIGQPYQAMPAQMRQDPTAVAFVSPPMGSSETLLGSPKVWLELATEQVPFQVTATFYHLSADGQRMLGRAATAPLAADHLDNMAVGFEFPWMKADLAPGDQLILKIGANDEGAFFPLMQNYAVDFTGNSTVSIPFFAPSGSVQ